MYLIYLLFFLQFFLLHNSISQHSHNKLVYNFTLKKKKTFPVNDFYIKYCIGIKLVFANKSVSQVQGV